MHANENMQGNRRRGFHPKNILGVVDIDKADDSQEVIECAVEMAQQHHARVRLMYVVEPTTFMSSLHAHTLPIVRTDEEVAQDAVAELLTLMDQFRGKGVEMEPMVRIGKPEAEIKKVADEMGADLIVISECHPTHFKAWHHGNAERVVHSSDCPVLVLEHAS